MTTRDLNRLNFSVEQKDSLRIPSPPHLDNNTSHTHGTLYMHPFKFIQKARWGTAMCQPHCSRTCRFSSEQNRHNPYLPEASSPACVRRTRGRQQSNIKAFCYQRITTRNTTVKGGRSEGVQFETVCLGTASLRRHQNRLKEVTILGEEEVQRPSEWDLHHRLPWFSDSWVDFPP